MNCNRKRVSDFLPCNSNQHIDELSMPLTERTDSWNFLNHQHFIYVSSERTHRPSIWFKLRVDKRGEKQNRYFVNINRNPISGVDKQKPQNEREKKPFRIFFIALSLMFPGKRYFHFTHGLVIVTIHSTRSALLRVAVRFAVPRPTDDFSPQFPFWLPRRYPNTSAISPNVHSYRPPTRLSCVREKGYLSIVTNGKRLDGE